MTELRILHVIPNLLKGGAQRLVLDICTELATRSGVKVKLISFDSKNEFSHLSNGIDIEFCHASVLPSVLGKWKEEIDHYHKVVDDFNPHIIHSHLYLAEIVTRHKHRPGVVYFTHCHDNMIQLEKPQVKTLFSKTRLTNFYERRSLLQKYLAADNNFIAISNDTAAFLKKVTPQSLRENIFLLLNAINTKAFNRPENSQPSGTIRLVNVGNLLTKKNQIFLLQVAKCLLGKGVDVQLKLIGDGQNRRLLENEITRLELQKNVEMLGAVDDVQKYLWQSDVYVHSALYEPFGLVLLEAMAAGLPVVSLDGKGNLDIVEDGKNGYLVKSANVELFADRVLQIISDQGKYQQMANYAKVFSEKFSVNEYVDKLLNLYSQKLN